MSGQGRSFLVIEQGEVESVYGYWVQDDDTGEEGFLPEFDDVFWTLTTKMTFGPPASSKGEC